MKIRANARETIAIFGLVVGLGLVFELALFAGSILSTRLRVLLAHPDERAASQLEVEMYQDPVLGRRPRPGVGDRDARGFRNPVALDEATVVCLGDSQTEGYGVRSVEAWPARVGELLSVPTYSMAIGGWGAVEGLHVLDEAIDLRPKVLIYALYAGNDLYDAYGFVYGRGQASRLKSVDPEITRQLREAEAHRPIADITRQGSRRFATGKPTVETGPAGPVPPPAATPITVPNSPRRWLSRNSRLYGLLRGVKNGLLSSGTDWQIAYRLDKEWRRLTQKATESDGYWEVFQRGDVRTILVPQYRMIALDTTDIRIREGQLLTYRAIDEMHRRAAAAAIRFTVLLIPTKSFVHGSLAPELSPNMSAFMHAESRFWSETKDFLDARSIPYVDALGSLRATIESGQAAYPQHYDGHPNAVGHAAIANAVAAYLGTR